MKRLMNKTRTEINEICFSPSHRKLKFLKPYYKLNFSFSFDSRPAAAVATSESEFNSNN